MRAPCGGARKRDHRAFGGETPALDRDVVRTESIGQVSTDRQMRRQWRRRGPSLSLFCGRLFDADERSRRHHRNSRRRRHREAAAAGMLREPAEGPLEQILHVGRTGKAKAGKLLKIGELAKVHAVHGRVEARGGTRAGAKRLDRIGEAGVAIEEPGARVSNVERRRRPLEGA